MFLFCFHDIFMFTLFINFSRNFFLDVFFQIKDFRFWWFNNMSFCPILEHNFYHRRYQNYKPFIKIISQRYSKSSLSTSVVLSQDIIVFQENLQNFWIMVNWGIFQFIKVQIYRQKCFDDTLERYDF